MSTVSTTQKTPIVDAGLEYHTIKKLPGPPEFTQELRMRQETDGVLLESFLIYEPEHVATWFKDGVLIVGHLDFDEKYQPFLERRGDWTYCALAIRHLSDEDEGDYMVNVRNKFGDNNNNCKLSMKDPNIKDPKGVIEPNFFRKPFSRQEGRKLHLEAEIEALPRPDITWFFNDVEIKESEKYSFYRGIQSSNPNIHFVRLTIQDFGPGDGGNFVIRAKNSVGEKDMTLGMNAGPNNAGDSDNEPARIYQQPKLNQVGSTLTMEAHIIANPRPKISWLCNGDFVKESDRKTSKLEEMKSEGKNKWMASLTIEKPTKADSGEYKCSAKNKWGNDHTTFQLG